MRPLAMVATVDGASVGFSLIVLFDGGRVG